MMLIYDNISHIDCIKTFEFYIPPYITKEISFSSHSDRSSNHRGSSTIKVAP